MPTIVIQHPIRDFETWKKAFVSDPLDRQLSGVIGHSIYRREQPGSVLVLLEFASRPEADAYLPRLQELWKGFGPGLGVGEQPSAEIFETVETVEY